MLRYTVKTTSKMTSNKNQNGLSLDKRDMKHKSAYIIYGNPTPRTTAPLKPSHPTPTKARHNPAPTERPPRSHPRATSISRQSPQPARFHHPIQNSTQNPPSATKTDRDTGHDLPRGGIPGPPHRVAECTMPRAALREASPLRYCSAAPEIPLSNFLPRQTLPGPLQECRNSGWGRILPSWGFSVSLLYYFNLQTIRTTTWLLKKLYSEFTLDEYFRNIRITS